MNIELLGKNKNIVKCLEDPKCAPHPQGLGILLMEKLKKYSNNIAEIEAETGRSSTYNDVLLRSIRVAQHLIAKNIKQNDIIVLCSVNNMSCSSVLYAALFLGIRIACLHPKLPKYDMEHLLKLAPPRFIFADDSCSETIAEIIKSLQCHAEIVNFSENKKYIPFSYFTQPTGTEMDFQARPVNSIDDTAMIFFSSGSSGSPKAICATHRALHSSQAQSSQGLDLTISLTFSSFYWISATMVLLYSALHGGARIVSVEGFKVETAMDIITKYKVTFAIFAQYYASLLAQKYNNTNFDTSSLSTLHIIGEKLLDTHMLKVKELFSHTAVSNGYGMTEANGYILIYNTKRDKQFIETKLGSCGRPMQGLTYKIVDVDSEEILGTNQKGELRIKGIMMDRYLDNPAATAAAFDSDGFFKTGDFAFYDEDYCFFITSRVKDIIKYQGFIESTAVMESFLLTHPEIKEAAVVAKPDPIDGDHAAAFITLHEESKLTKEQINEYYNEKIFHHAPKILRGGIFIIDNMPRTPNDKLKKVELKKYLQN